MRYEAVGKPLGGAKKYRWKSSGLTLEDLDELNLKEKYQFVKKNNIWKKPNYEELVASGLPIRVAYYMKKIGKMIPFLSYREERLSQIILNIIGIVSNISSTMHRINKEQKELQKHQRKSDLFHHN